MFSATTVNAQSNVTGAPLPNIDPSGIRDLCPGTNCPISLESNPFDCLPNCSVEPVNPVVDALQELGDKIKLELPIGDDTVIGVDPKPKEPSVFIRVGPKQKTDQIPEPSVPKVSEKSQSKQKEILKEPPQCVPLNAITPKSAGSNGLNGSVCMYGCNQLRSLGETARRMCRNYGTMCDTWDDYYAKEIPNCCTVGSPIC